MLSRLDLTKLSLHAQVWLVYGALISSSNYADKTVGWELLGVLGWSVRSARVLVTNRNVDWE